MFFVLLASVLLASCEDLIDVEVKDAEPQLVIAANMSPFDATVVVSKTVPFGSDQPFSPVSGAQVMLFNVSDGAYMPLFEASPGKYRPDPKGLYIVSDVEQFLTDEFMVYAIVDSIPYSANARAVPPVIIDSVGTSVNRVFDEERKYAMVKFQDPAGVPNYYQFFQSVNGGPFKMLFVANDKFNDGKYVSEVLTDRDFELKTGDSVAIRMRSINKSTYDFWEAVAAANSGAAAPANPPSAFYGALGYFNVYTESQTTTVIK